jgi:hypothetical protein
MHSEIVVEPLLAQQRTKLRMPSLVGCGLAIHRIRRLLLTRGFDGTMQWIRQRVEMIPPTMTVEAEIVREAERCMALAAGLYPRRAQCLEQSLALYYLLRRQGIGVRYCQGIQRHPFSAHAWLEYRGDVLNDVREHVKHFAPLPDLLP